MNKLDLTLYLITDSTGMTDEKIFKTVEEACRGGVTCVQLREKDKSGLDYLNLAIKTKMITDKYNVPLIIDDRVDIAMASDAAGVHVGQSDIPVFAARKLLGENKIIGASAKTVEQAKKAAAEGADYLGVGAIFPTTTKVVTVITKVETLNEIAETVDIPVVAIGGLNESNVHVLYKSGAVGIAVVSAIMKSDDPYSAAKILKKQVTGNFSKLMKLRN